MKHNGSLPDSFPISNGAKQGCVLASTLFSIFFSSMPREAKEDLPDGFYVRFRTGGSLLNLRRLFAYTKTTEELITELLFANDCTLLTHTEEALHHIINCFSVAAKNFGLTLNLKKTELLYQPPPREAYSPPHISIDGTNLNAVEHFTYLGSVISNDATVSTDLDNHLSKTSSCCGRLSRKVLQSHSLCLTTKIQLYKAIIVTTLLYGAETWVLYQKQIRLLERFHQRCLRSILGIKWQDHMSNEEVLKRASLPSIEPILPQVQLLSLIHI